MTEVHEGGCLCGDVRYTVHGQPVRTTVCHCTYCQRRTGAAFAVLPAFRAEAVTFLRGEAAFHRHRSDGSGRWLDTEFCRRCGTTVATRVERSPGVVVIAGGTFDDPRWFRVDRHIWTRSKLPWVALPAGCEALETG